MSFSVAVGGSMPPSASPPCFTPSTGSRYKHRGGTLLMAWAALSPVVSAGLSYGSRQKMAFASSPMLQYPFRSCCISSPSPFALNALILDDSAVYHTDTANTPASLAASLQSLSSTNTNTNYMAKWNPLQKDISQWLAVSPSDTDTSMDSVSALSTSSTILSTSDAQSSPDRSPTKDEIAQLQQAFAAFYGMDRNVPEAYNLLTKCIGVWEGTNQGGDEIAGLYRVRGDVNMELFQPKEAEADYAKAIQYLEGPDGDKADPDELPASRLGRARAVRSMGSSATPSQALQASKDYEIYFSLTSRLDGDDEASASKGNSDKTSFSEAIIDGIQRNPYAAWEWGMVERVAKEYERAAEIHRLAASAFEEIGDKPRSVICALDRGLDLASGLDNVDGSSSKEYVKKVSLAMEEAISSDVNVEGRDVELLQRVVAKEGEARIALSGVLWNSNSKSAAETQYGTACSRLDELNADYRAREADRIKKGRMPPIKPRGASLGFSIDDIVGADEASCSRFKNEKFIEEKLVWNEGLRTKVYKFLTLSR